MKRFVCMCALLSSSACASLYDVHRGTEKVTGIPFYIQAGSCTQETVYLETIYQIVLQVPTGEKTPAVVIREKAVPASVYRSQTMRDLRTALAAKKPEIAIVALFDALSPYSPDVDPEVSLVSNVTKPDSYIDYANIHYVNVQRPAIGSASATAKLNANGTLAENTAEVEDKTLETLLATLPIKEALLGTLTDSSMTPSIVGGDSRQPASVLSLILINC
jgi:hypothetical protein